MANQDYLWASTSFLHIFMYLLRDSFSYVYQVAHSSMVIFRCINEVSYDLESLSKLKIDMDLINETFDWSEYTMKDVDPRLLYLCRAFAFHITGFKDHAKYYYRKNKLYEEGSNQFYNIQLKMLQQRWADDFLQPSN